MNSIIRHQRGILGLVALMLTLVLIAPASRVQAAGNPNPGVLPINSHPGGKTYSEWSDAWWQWAFSIPVPPNNPQSHPLFDETGINCGVGQTGNVWFLAGIFNITGSAVRNNCIVPSGKMLFVPILNAEWDTTDGTPIDQLRTFLAGNMSHVIESSLEADVDGVSMHNLASYRAGSVEPVRPIYDTTLPENNVYQYFGANVPAGTYQAVSDGYYLMLSPLSPGTHTIHFHGSIEPPIDFTLDITYHLTVAAGR